MSLFAHNRSRLVQEVRKRHETGLVFLAGGRHHLGLCRGDSGDVGPLFRQEPFFHWAFGVLQPDCFGAVDVKTGKSLLFVPRVKEEDAMWDGKLLHPQDYRDM